MLYQGCDLPDNSKDDMKREARAAKRELDKSKKSLTESKMTTPERLLTSLREGTFEVTVDEAVCRRALASVQRMIAIGSPSCTTRACAQRARPTS